MFVVIKYEMKKKQPYLKKTVATHNFARLSLFCFLNLFFYYLFFFRERERERELLTISQRTR